MKHEILLSAPPIIRDFLTYNETIKGKSSLTVDEYYRDLQTFFKYLLLIRGIADKKIPFEEIDISSVDAALISTVTISDLYSFIVFCKDERDNNAATRARKTSTLRIFFKYLTAQIHLLETNPAEMLDSPKVKNALPKHLTLEDSIQLLSVVDGPNKERDYCILTLFLNCGMRLSELCGLNLSDIRADGTMRLLGKGNKERIVYINDACANAIRDYLAVRPNDAIEYTDRNALFISRNKKRISNKTVQHIVKTYLEKPVLVIKAFPHTSFVTRQQHLCISTVMLILGCLRISWVTQI